MNVVFVTNLDWYRGLAWPVLNCVPRIGERVHVHISSEPFCEANKLPKVLEVTNVTYHFDRVVCELEYRKMDLNCTDVRFKHLMKQ